MCSYSDIIAAVIYTARLSFTLTQCSEIQRFECSDAVEVCNEVVVAFYIGLAHTILCHENTLCFGGVFLCKAFLLRILLCSQLIMLDDILTHNHTEQLLVKMCT